MGGFRSVFPGGGWQQQPGTECQSPRGVGRVSTQGQGGNDGNGILVIYWEADQ